MKQIFDLDKVLMDMSTAKHKAQWTIRDSVEGLQIFGGIGSGKTSGSGRYFALKYLSNGYGGLVLTAKHDETELWEEYCRLTNRTDDLVIVEPGGKYFFNFLEYESKSAQDAKSFTLNIVQVLKTVIRANKEKSGSKGDDQFWETALDMVLANSIDLCLLAYDKVTVKMLYDIVQSAPKKTATNATADKDKKEKERPKPYQIAVDRAMKRIRNQVDNWRSKMTEKELDAIKDDYEFTRLATEALPDVRTMNFVNNFFTDNFKNLADRTRSVIEFSFVGFLYNLLREPTYSLFCRYPSNFTPEDSLKGKIIIINLPVKDYHKMGQDCQIMFKYIWQRAMERRRIKDNGRPVFLWADESQNFLHEHDAAYQATARSSRIATVYISQNLPNYFANMGGEQSAYKVKSFMGTLATKLFHANADIETNEYASKLIGDGYTVKDSESSTVSGEFSSSRSVAYELARIIRPEQFIGLKTGGPGNQEKVEGIIHTQGKQLMPDMNHKKIRFDQNFTI
jgi:type IV secretory pathway TraG/TraD family ATPase VirD4